MFVAPVSVPLYLSTHREDFSHLIIAAAQLLSLGRVRRVDGSLLVNDAVVAVTGSDYLHQPFINGAQRVHTCKQKHQHRLYTLSLLIDHRST